MLQPPRERRHTGKPAWLDKVPLETSQQWVSGERSRTQKSLWYPVLGPSCALALVLVKANPSVSSPVVLPSPPVAAAGAMGTGRTRCRVHSPSQAHRCHPALLSARAPQQPRCPPQPWPRSRAQPERFISCARDGPSARHWRPPWPAAPSLWPGRAGFSVHGWGHQVTGTPFSPFSWEQVSWQLGSSARAMLFLLTPLAVAGWLCLDKTLPQIRGHPSSF